MQRPKRVEPGPGQESVWDYPRPPRLERVRSRIQVIFCDVTIADTTRAWRVLETSHPPVYYLPQEDMAMQHLRPVGRSSFCEWKGHASYFDVHVGNRVVAGAAWCYPQPTPTFAPIRDHVALYPASMDRCTVDGKTVTPQPGSFYAGWITDDVVGPFKGVPGSDFW